MSPVCRAKWGQPGTSPETSGEKRGHAATPPAVEEFPFVCNASTRSAEAAARHAPSWRAVTACRRRAETAEELSEIWQATVCEVALRWRAAGRDEDLWLPEGREVALQDEIGAAMLAGDRARALERIEEWRRSWIQLLGQREIEPDGRLDVIHAPGPRPPGSAAAGPAPAGARAATPAAQAGDLSWLSRLVETGAADRLAPFAVTRWARVSDPGRFARSMLRALERGGDRALAGLAGEALGRLREVLEAEGGEPREGGSVPCGDPGPRPPAATGPR